MRNSPLNDVNPEFCVYKLDDVFNAAVNEHAARSADLTRFYREGNEMGISQNKALVSRAVRVVEALKDFKAAGKNYLMTKYPLENNPLKSRAGHDLADQLEKKQAKAIKMDLPSPV